LKEIWCRVRGGRGGRGRGRKVGGGGGARKQNGGWGDLGLGVQERAGGRRREDGCKMETFLKIYNEKLRKL
jgi:hypothetical protein